MRFGKKRADPGQTPGPLVGQNDGVPNGMAPLDGREAWDDEEAVRAGGGAAPEGGRSRLFRGPGSGVLDDHQIEGILDADRREESPGWRPKPITVLGVLFAAGLLIASMLSGPAAQVPPTRAFFVAAAAQTPLVELVSGRVGVFCVASPGAGWQGVEASYLPGIRSALDGRDDTGRIRVALLAFNGDPLGGGDIAQEVAGQRLEVEGGAWCAPPSAVDLLAVEGGARLIDRSMPTP